MIDHLIGIKQAWDAGGVWIYPIHIVGILSISIVIERVYFLYAKSSMNAQAFLNQVVPLISRKDYQAAMQFCDSISAPTARVTKSIILRGFSSKNSRDDIEAVIEGALAKEAHPLEKRTSYLSMLANIATLLGLLGTISGLIRSFAAVAQIDPSQKSTMLATGISEAMNVTAYGLVVAIFSLVAFAIIQGKTQSLLDEMKEAAFETRNAVLVSQDNKRGAA